MRDRRAAERRGHRAETLAAWALRLKGYRIVARRFRCKAGEADLIARRGKLVAIVEVKARGDERAALDAVGAKARRRIAAAGLAWAAKQRDFAELSLRHDVVAVVPGRWPRHFPNVW